ncbi:hypothetical protein BDA96_04G347900 [Sorghum bicolor]|uniref:Uncharacterized protein n=1 Tax=Sorghum bicolor TaxID=4558 RepID=A0A921UMX0_SORBI|nr:hypothetical protein BDA96_04G347900 [Sorghum bicolor]
MMAFSAPSWFVVVSQNCVCVCVSRTEEEGPAGLTVQVRGTAIQASFFSFFFLLGVLLRGADDKMSSREISVCCCIFDFFYKLHFRVGGPLGLANSSVQLMAHFIAYMMY